MTTMPNRPPVDLSDDTEWDALVIRTDFSDDPAWQHITTVLQQESWTDESEASCHFVDDLGWAGAEADEVLAVLPEDPPEVVFLADAISMRGKHPLLAVSTDPDMEDVDDDFPGLGSTCRFRLLLPALAEMVGNLTIGNMDFEDFSRSAHGDTQKIHRGFG
ncbi:DUF6924 domain-containing protein [Streptomyces sp. NPDC048527]|uniref:DUF6924 domain-containing protein n=1 Tax=Streptomyces sp. NPDC048527 TaxID=3365568 RepID=UPI0037172BD6